MQGFNLLESGNDLKAFSPRAVLLEFQIYQSRV